MGGREVKALGGGGTCAGVCRKTGGAHGLEITRMCVRSCVSKRGGGGGGGYKSPLWSYGCVGAIRRCCMFVCVYFNLQSPALELTVVAKSVSCNITRGCNAIEYCGIRVRGSAWCVRYVLDRIAGLALHIAFSLAPCRAMRMHETQDGNSMMSTSRPKTSKRSSVGKRVCRQNIVRRAHAARSAPTATKAHRVLLCCRPRARVTRDGAPPCCDGGGAPFCR